MLRIHDTFKNYCKQTIIIGIVHFACKHNLFEKLKQVYTNMTQILLKSLKIY